MAAGRSATRGRRLTFGVTVLLALGAATYLVWDRPTSGPAPRATQETSVATVERRDLVVTEKFNGALGFADERTIVTARNGTVTATAKIGQEVPFGASLFAINQEPTILLRGSLPAYRNLSESSPVGPDIRQLEQGLEALGYAGGLKIDDEFTEATGDAVKKWEEAIGRSVPDRIITQGEVVFSPTPLRINSIPSPGGMPVSPGSAVIVATSPDRVVNLDIESKRAGELRVNQPATLTLPGGKSSSATIIVIGSQLQPPPVGDSAAPTLAVTVRIDQPQAAAGFATGSVEVTVEKSRDRQALVVPVTALLALAEGGYAVQIIDPNNPARYTLVPVDVGTVTDEDAAVTGALRPGTKVLVPV